MYHFPDILKNKCNMLNYSPTVFLHILYKMFNDDFMSKFSSMKFEFLGFIIDRAHSMMILKTVYMFCSFHDT